MSLLDVGVALLLLVGLVGIVVPVLPGLLVMWAAVALWAFDTSTSTGWWVFGAITVIWLAGTVLQYAVPGRRMRAAGVATSTLIIGVAVGIVCAVLLPVVGFLVGFPLGIYLVERRRRGTHPAAWSSTKHALRAVVTTIGIELLTGILILAVWIVAVWRF